MSPSPSACLCQALRRPSLWSRVWRETRILLFKFLKYQKLVGEGARNRFRTTLVVLFKKYLSSTPLTSNSYLQAKIQV